MVIRWQFIVPLSEEAQAEARFYASVSLIIYLKPSDGKPVSVPTQDMVLGILLSYIGQKMAEPGEGKILWDPNEAIMAYHNQLLRLHAKIKVES